MPEPVARSNAERSNQEHKETTEYLLNFIDNKLQESGLKTDAEISIKIDKETVYQSKIAQKPVQDTLTEEGINQIRTALENPQQLKGSLSIFIGKEKFFHAKNGKVITDYLKLAREPREREAIIQIQEKFEEVVVAGSGKEIANLAARMLDFIGETNQRQEVEYIGNKYIFTKKGAELSVTCKNGRGEIVNQDGFTEVANEQDYACLSHINQELLEKLKLECFPSQQPSLRIR
jgi:hypothetical protein